MKKILNAIVAIAFVAVASTAFAAPPDVVTLQAKPGNVTFPHKAHMSQGCAKCHEAKPPAKFELTKDKAHALCIDCHKEKGKGPGDAKACTTCHKK